MTSLSVYKLWAKLTCILTGQLILVVTVC